MLTFTDNDNKDKRTFFLVDCDGHPADSTQYPQTTGRFLLSIVDIDDDDNVDDANIFFVNGYTFVVLVMLFLKFFLSAGCVRMCVWRHPSNWQFQKDVL